MPLCFTFYHTNLTSFAYKPENLQLSLYFTLTEHETNLKDNIDVLLQRIVYSRNEIYVLSRDIDVSLLSSIQTVHDFSYSDLSESSVNKRFCAHPYLSSHYLLKPRQKDSFVHSLNKKRYVTPLKSYPGYVLLSKIHLRKIADHSSCTAPLYHKVTFILTFKDGNVREFDHIFKLFAN